MIGEARGNEEEDGHIKSQYLFVRCKRSDGNDKMLPFSFSLLFKYNFFP